MILAKIDTFPLHIPFKPDTQAAASAWGDKGLLVAECRNARDWDSTRLAMAFATLCELGLTPVHKRWHGDHK